MLSFTSLNIYNLYYSLFNILTAVSMISDTLWSVSMDDFSIGIDSIYLLPCLSGYFWMLDVVEGWIELCSFKEC